MQNVFTIFDKYEIVEGARPDTVAEEYYGNSQLDWVVLITAGIINVRNEWPLSNRDLYYYALNIYDDENSLNDIHHYETKEIKDSLGRLILPKGKNVDSNFSITYYRDGSNITPVPSDTVQGISNWEYETLENDKKRSIYLLKRMYLQQFLNDMRNIMIYQKSSQRINDRLAKTENTKVTMP